MKFTNLKILVVLALLKPALSIAANEPTESQVGWTFGVESDQFIVADKDDKAKLQILASNIFARFNGEGDGKAQLKDLFNGDTTMTGFTLVIKASVAGKALDSRVEDELAEKVEDFFIQNAAAIEYQIRQALSANPMFVAAPPAVQDQLVQVGIETVMADKLNTNHERLGHVVDEVTAQEITIGMPFFVNENQDIYFKLGKEHTEATPFARDKTRISPDKAQTLGSTGGTGFIAVGSQLTTDSGMVITTEIRAFSERPAYLEAFDYLARYINASDDEYDNYKNIYSLNSVGGKIEVSTEDRKIQFGASAYDHNGDRGNEYTVWGNFEVSHNTRLGLTSFSGNNGLSANSIELSRAMGAFTAHVRQTWVRGYDHPTTLDKEKDNYTETAVGASYSFRTFHVLRANCQATSKIEVVRSNSMQANRTWDPAVGTYVKCQNN
ncbi:MAG: hypothetical protein KDD37_03475 [Bdellovibrionales bacterium]|nr:hypothetical protein [Bdellovibrionales bacterium]